MAMVFYFGNAWKPKAKMIWLSAFVNVSALERLLGGVTTSAWSFTWQLQPFL